MSQSRDLFPIASEEAQVLQASVEGGSNLNDDWNSMSSESHNKGPSDMAIEKSENERSESFKGMRNKTTGFDDTDIYANMEQPEN
jgi:hypothetical protein